MKQYKLIKEYPGSPELGAIVSFYDSQQSYAYLDITSTTRFISSSLIEKNPEFWEEIIEKDYEILEIFIPKTKQILSWEKDVCFDTFWKNKECWLEYHLDKEPKSKIHSVKRLSDGKIFTVGDKIRHTNNVIYPEGIITKLHIVSDTIFVETNNRIKGFDTNICSVYKFKKPLFTTEDGVDIYEGDRVSVVSLNTMKLYTINGSVGCFTTPEEGFKYFSTKEAAEEYILMNKPCLSIKDVQSIYVSAEGNYNENGNGSNYFEKLKQLVKSKKSC